MEEKKEKKKLNKKPLLICLAIALVFALIGIVDINVNAAESQIQGPVIEEQYLNVEESYIFDSGETIHRKWDFGVPECRVAFLYCDCEYDDNCRGYTLYCDDALEDSIGTYYWKCLLTRTEYDENSEEIETTTETAGQYCHTDDNQQGLEWYDSGSLHYDGIFYESLNIDTNVPIFTNFTALQNYLSTGTYNKDDVKVEIDYDNLPVDYSIPIPQNVKRNIISEDFWEPSTNTWYVSNSYEYTVWENTSDLKLQIQTLPVVQYFKLYAKHESFVQQFHGNEWNDSQILDGGTNKYTIQTDINYLKDNSKDDYDFYNLCLEQKELGFHEQPFFFYAYQIRYVDEDAEKAGPWLCIYPNEIFNGTNIFSVDENGELSNTESNMGEVVEKPTGESTLDETLKDIDNTLEFKDKYDVVDGDVDTQEAANWLYSVVNFIKGTPQVVGSVLGFLPQPILYGMYVTIFLGVIASGIAIVKALI